MEQVNASLKHDEQNALVAEILKWPFQRRLSKGQDTRGDVKIVYCVAQDVTTTFL